MDRLDDVAAAESGSKSGNNPDSAAAALTPSCWWIWWTARGSNPRPPDCVRPDATAANAPGRQRLAGKGA